MAKKNEGSIVLDAASWENVGSNVEATDTDSEYFYFRVAKAGTGRQTKNSKGFNEDGSAKKPQEMVGSTNAFREFGEGEERVMIHVIRPLSVKAKRAARANAELAEEEANETAVDVSALKALALKEGISLKELVSMLQGK